MANNSVNLALRFVLEMAALAALGYWGWTQHSGFARWGWTLALVIGAAFLWGTFRVPDDPGAAPVAVPGIVRLLLEAAFFGAAVALLALAGRQQWAIVLGVVLVLHYAVSYDRIQWLLKQ